MELDFIRNYFVEKKLNVSSSQNQTFQITHTSQNKKLSVNQEFLRSLYNSNLQIKWSNFNSIYKKSEPNLKVKTQISSPVSNETNVAKFKPHSFYKKRTTALQKKLSHVPVYVVLNGRGELVLANPHVTNSTDSKIGFFFINRQEAKEYLNNIVASDFIGTKTVGLSIHSVGLDFAYNLTRQSNTHTDFRFVPSFEEIRTLIKSKKQRSLIFEIPNKQLQEVNIKKWKWQNIENLSKGWKWVKETKNGKSRLGLKFIKRNKREAFNKRLSLPYLQRTHSKYQSFKGVPIYIVQTVKVEKSKLASIKPVIGKFETQPLEQQFKNSLKSRGANLKVANKVAKEWQDDIATYIFFNKIQAENFCSKTKTTLKSIPGIKNVDVGTTINSKLRVFNLEDFLEILENKMMNSTLFDEEQQMKTLENIYFIPDQDAINSIKKQSQSLQVKQPWLLHKGNRFLLKTKTLARYLEIALTPGLY